MKEKKCNNEFVNTKNWGKQKTNQTKPKQHKTKQKSGKMSKLNAVIFVALKN